MQTIKEYKANSKAWAAFLASKARVGKLQAALTKAKEDGNNALKNYVESIDWQHIRARTPLQENERYYYLNRDTLYTEERKHQYVAISGKRVSFHKSKSEALNAHDDWDTFTAQLLPRGEYKCGSLPFDYP